MFSFDNIVAFAKSALKFLFSLRITSPTFFIALSVLLLVYYSLPLKKRAVVFAAANVLFVYGASGGGKWALLCMALMLGSTWLFAQYCNGRRAVFVLAVLFDIAILLLLKDAKFFARILRASLSDNAMNALHRFSPIGISYWTLALVAYLVDVHKGKTKAQRNFAGFTASAVFFPTLISGPILRLGRDDDYILQGHKFDCEKFCFGVQRIVWGAFKKIVVADRAAIVVAKVFDGQIGEYRGLYIWLAIAMYFVQLFADFSGCIDIALGSAELFGINLPQNFDLPFASKSIAEFWRRWHITLGAWLRDYVYIPLGGSRKGKARKHLNIMLVFLASGLWHGGAVKFLAWGFLHGAYQVIGEITSPLRRRICKKANLDTECFAFRLWRCAVVFVLNLAAWMFFRAGSFTSALRLLKASMHFNLWIFFDGSLFDLGLDMRNCHFLIAGMAAMCVQGIVKMRFGSTKNFLKKQPLVFCALLNIPLALFVALSMNISTQEFLYGSF